MIISNETLGACLDDEFPAPETERVRGAVASDTELAARLEQLAGVDPAPVEPGLEIERRSPPLPGELRAPPGRIARAASSLEPKWWQRTGRLTIAAMLLVAVPIGLRLMYRDTSLEGFEGITRGGLVQSSHPLHHALEHIASGDTYISARDSGISITPVLSFESAQREYCREFGAVTDTRAVRGLACRRHERWETLRISDDLAGNEIDDAYQPGIPEPDAGFEAFVDGMIVDVPLGASEERVLLQNRWRTP